jgi:hypothetical protein
VPFRDAHEQVAAQVRSGEFQRANTLKWSDRGIDVGAAVNAAKERWS